VSEKVKSKSIIFGTNVTSHSITLAQTTRTCTLQFRISDRHTTTCDDPKSVYNVTAILKPSLADRDVPVV